jgi:hypothetical protein
MNFQHPPALYPPTCRRIGLIVKVCAFSSNAPGMDNLNLCPLSIFEVDQPPVISGSIFWGRRSSQNVQERNTIQLMRKDGAREPI